MNQEEIFLNFQGVRVRIASSWKEILIKLSKDFSFYITERSDFFDLNLEVYKESVTVPNEVTWDRATYKVRYYDEEDFRFCFYDKKVRSEICFHKGDARVFGLDENLVHEICYLLTLTRVGKILDLNGLHRLHGLGFIYNKKLVLGLFPSGGGKTTFLSHLMARSEAEILSDDSPLVDLKGEVHPFLIRIGFEEEGIIPKEWINLPFYLLERRHFGLKKLLSLTDISIKTGKEYKEVILLRASKKRKKDFSWKREFGLIHFYHMVKEGVVGFGLPMLFEYFWENGYKDFFKKTKIAFSRMISMSMLWIKAKKIRVVFTNDPYENVNSVLDELKRS